MSAKPRLLVISQVMPYPGAAGQQVRVANKLTAFRNSFHITFLTSIPQEQHDSARVRLLEHCDEAILLPARYPGSILAKAWYRANGLGYTLSTGLKFSNYLVSQVEFTPARAVSALGGASFDLALFEYWHAVDLVPLLHERGIPCVLDMHDILWRSYQHQLEDRGWLPAWLVNRLVSQYRLREQAAWDQFDALIAINQAELDDARQVVSEHKPIFYAPMGVDLDKWPYSWQPAQPPRVAYYGGLGSPHNQRDALLCYGQIMPIVWETFPQAELWLVGSHPPNFIRALASDPRVTVTGYVERVQDVLATMSLVLCPWSGTYGFRSRLVEVMALGVPVVASPNAVYGMGFHSGNGIQLAETPHEIAQSAFVLLNDPKHLKEQSMLGRAEIEKYFSFETSYGKLTLDLVYFLTKQ